MEELSQTNLQKELKDLSIKYSPRKMDLIIFKGVFLIDENLKGLGALSASLTAPRFM